LPFKPPDSTALSFPINKKPVGPKGWELVGNFGAYWGNKYQAAFYNGSKSNVNNINFVLSNYTWNNEIKNILLSTVNRDSFALSETPSKMKYSTTMHVGFGGRYNFNPEWAFNVEFNQAKLMAKDFFTIEVFPAFDNESHSYLQYPIWGIETRTNIQVGVLRTLNTTKKVRPIIELGAVFTNTHVKESKISIEDQPYNLVNIYSGSYVPNSNVQEYEIRQGGLGFGGYMNGGVKIMFSNFVSAELFATLYFQQINLEGYNAFKMNEALMFRFVLSPGFFVAKEQE
jgi:hypothetical protein